MLGAKALRQLYSAQTKYRCISMSSLKYADPLVRQPKGQPSGVLIFLHGLGDSGHGWFDSLLFLTKQIPGLKIICPHAPHRSITLNMGLKMPGWYDIFALEPGSKEDIEGMDASRTYINQLIQAEIDAGTPANKIVVGGFSQGGAMTYHTVYSSELKLAGGVVLSGYLPSATSFSSRLTESGKSVPLFAAHGTMDPVVDYEYGKKSYDFVTECGINAEFKTIKNMGHSANQIELNQMGEFISKVLSDNPAL